MLDDTACNIITVMMMVMNILTRLCKCYCQLSIEWSVHHIESESVSDSFEQLWSVIEEKEREAKKKPTPPLLS